MAPSDPKGPSGLFGDDEDDLDAALDKWTEEFDKFKAPGEEAKQAAAKPAVAKPAAAKPAPPRPPATPPAGSTPSPSRPLTNPPLDVGEFLDGEDSLPQPAATSSIKPLGEMLGTDDDLLGRGYTEVFKSVKPQTEAADEFNQKVPTRPDS